VDLIRPGGDQVMQELRGYHPTDICLQLGMGKHPGTSDGDKQVQLTFVRANLGNIDAEVPIGYDLNFFFCDLSPVISGK
jgi:hypothetical protein